VAVVGREEEEGEGWRVVCGERRTKENGRTNGGGAAVMELIRW